jgi:hypothetical protein
VIRNVYAQAGQSDGIAWETRGISVPGGYTASPKVRIWKHCGQFETYEPGVNSDPTLNSTGWGAECAFAIEYQSRYPGRCLDLYKDTPGGTPLTHVDGDIADWSSYSVNEGGVTTKRFPLMVDRLSAALNAIQLGTPKRTPILGGVILDGCQSDCLSASAAAAIEDELPAWIGALRDIFHSHIRLLVVQVHPDAAAHVDPLLYPTVYTNEVREALVAAVSRDPMAALIDVDDQSINLGHVVPAGIFVKGQRLFAADQALQGF